MDNNIHSNVRSSNVPSKSKQKIQELDGYPVEIKSHLRTTPSKRKSKKLSNITSSNDIIEEIEYQKQTVQILKQEFEQEFNEFSSSLPAKLLDLQPISQKPKEKRESKGDTHKSTPLPIPSYFDEHYLQNAYNTFFDHVYTFTPHYQFNPDLEVGMFLFKTPINDLHKINDPSRLLNILEHGIIAACAFQAIADANISNQFFTKSTDMLHSLFFLKEAHVHQAYAQKLIDILLIYQYYYATNADEFTRHSTLSMIHHVISMHYKSITKESIQAVRNFVSLFNEELNNIHPYETFPAYTETPQDECDIARSAFKIVNALHPKEDFGTILKHHPDTSRSLLENLRSLEQHLQFDWSHKMKTNIRMGFTMLIKALIAELSFVLGDVHESIENIKVTIDMAKKTQAWSFTRCIALHIALLTAAYLKNEVLIKESQDVYLKFNSTFGIMRKLQASIESIMKKG